MKKKKQWQSHSVTLIELMIVMAIIALIGGVIMFNLHGSMGKSKDFVTQQKMERLQQALTLQLIEKPGLRSKLRSKWKELALQDPLLRKKNSKDSPLEDAWGNEFEVSYRDNEVVVEQKKTLR